MRVCQRRLINMFCSDYKIKKKDIAKELGMSVQNFNSYVQCKLPLTLNHMVIIASMADISVLDLIRLGESK